MPPLRMMPPSPGCCAASWSVAGSQVSVTLGISAVVANQAALLRTQGLCAAAWADPAAAGQRRETLGTFARGQRLGLRTLLLARLAGRSQEAGADHVRLNDAADGSEQARHIASTHPLPALGIEHGLELLDDEGDV